MMLKGKLLKSGCCIFLSYLMITSLHAMEGDEAYTLNKGRCFGTEMEMDEENLSAITWFLNLDPKTIWLDDEKVVNDAGGFNGSTTELTPDEIAYADSFLASAPVDSRVMEIKGMMPHVSADEILVQGTVPVNTTILPPEGTTTWFDRAQSCNILTSHPTQNLQNMPIKMELSSIDYGRSMSSTSWDPSSYAFTSISQDLFEKEELEDDSEDEELKDEFTIYTGLSFEITGPEAVILRDKCTSFEKFKAFYGQFSQTESIEQMKLEIALHLLNVKALKELNSYRRVYGAGACSVQCRSGATRHLGDIVYDNVRKIRGTWDQLSTGQIMIIHESMKKHLTGAKIIFKKS